VKSAVLSPQARRDLLDATRWIARDNPTAARALRDAVKEAAARIVAHPESGAVRVEFSDPPTRFLVLTGLPYILVYDSEPRPPLILRVLHGARDLPELLKSGSE
jgi:toxin ParE1/3/4